MVSFLAEGFTEVLKTLLEHKIEPIRMCVLKMNEAPASPRGIPLN